MSIKKDSVDNEVSIDNATRWGEKRPKVKDKRWKVKGGSEKGKTKIVWKRLLYRRIGKSWVIGLSRWLAEVEFDLIALSYLYLPNGDGICVFAYLLLVRTYDQYYLPTCYLDLSCR